MLQMKSESIVQCDRVITKPEIDEIQETVGIFPNLSRMELASTICEHLGWFTAGGGYKVDACMKLLEKLESKGFVKLPVKRNISVKPRRKKQIPLTSRTEFQDDIVGSLKDVGPVSAKVVKDKESAGLWNEYVSRYHYLGYKKPFGYVLRYFIESERGILGCLLFAGGSKSMTLREQWIGWTEIQRFRNLAWVTNNNRFVIFPWVRVKNLGSYILGQIARRIKADWHERWGYSPVLMETFVDPQYYKGTCYKAANWQCLGMTTGEGLVRKGKVYTTTPKNFFVMPLVKDWRSLLCSEKLVGRVDIWEGPTAG